MREYITISVSYDSGEANLTPRSQAIIDNMIHEADLLDYDLLSDMRYIFLNAFDDMEINYHAKLKEAQKTRLAKREKENAS
jgi:hypothetical protein